MTKTALPPKTTLPKTFRVRNAALQGRGLGVGPDRKRAPFFTGTSRTGAEIAALIDVLELPVKFTREGILTTTDALAQGPAQKQLVAAQNAAAALETSVRVSQTGSGSLMVGPQQPWFNATNPDVEPAVDAAVRAGGAFGINVRVPHPYFDGYQTGATVNPKTDRVTLSAPVSESKAAKIAKDLSRTVIFESEGKTHLIDPNGEPNIESLYPDVTEDTSRTVRLKADVPREKRVGRGQQISSETGRLVGIKKEPPYSELYADGDVLVLRSNLTSLGDRIELGLRLTSEYEKSILVYSGYNHRNGYKSIFTEPNGSLSTIGYDQSEIVALSGDYDKKVVAHPVETLQAVIGDSMNTYNVFVNKLGVRFSDSAGSYQARIRSDGGIAVTQLDRSGGTQAADDWANRITPMLRKAPNPA